VKNLGKTKPKRQADLAKRIFSPKPEPLPKIEGIAKAIVTTAV